MTPEQIRTFRERRGWSQVRLAVELGTDKYTVCRWETGRQKVSPYYAEQLYLLFKSEIEKEKEGGTEMDRLRRGLVGLAVGTFAGIGPDMLNSIARVAINGCWHELNQDIKKTEQVLLLLHPALINAAVSGQNKKERETAVSLAIESCFLRSLVEKHKLNPDGCKFFSAEALQLSTLTKEPVIRSAALMYRAYSLWDEPESSIALYKRSLAVLGDTDSILRSDVLNDMAKEYSLLKDERNALSCIEQAMKYYPKNPERDIAYNYADCPLSLMYQWNAKAYMNLGRLQEAEQELLKSENANPTRRGSCENKVLLAELAIKKNDLEFFADSLSIGVREAIDIGSQHRYTIAKTAFESIPDRWKKEQRIIELGMLFQR